MRHRSGSTTTGHQVASGRSSSRSGVETNTGPSKRPRLKRFFATVASSWSTTSQSRSLNGDQGWARPWRLGSRTSVPCAIIATRTPRSARALASRKGLTRCRSANSGRPALIITCVKPEATYSKARAARRRSCGRRPRSPCSRTGSRSRPGCAARRRCPRLGHVAAHGLDPQVTLTGEVGRADEQPGAGLRDRGQLLLRRDRAEVHRGAAPARQAPGKPGRQVPAHPLQSTVDRRGKAVPTTGHPPHEVHDDLSHTSLEAAWGLGHVRLFLRVASWWAPRACPAHRIGAPRRSRCPARAPTSTRCVPRPHRRRRSRHVWPAVADMTGGAAGTPPFGPWTRPVELARRPGTARSSSTGPHHGCTPPPDES